MFFLIMVINVGSCVPLPEREEEKQCDHGSTAVSGVFPEYTVRNLPSGYGGLHQCAHTKGSFFFFFFPNVNTCFESWCKFIESILNEVSLSLLFTDCLVCILIIKRDSWYVWLCCSIQCTRNDLCCFKRSIELLRGQIF